MMDSAEHGHKAPGVCFHKHPIRFSHHYLECHCHSASRCFILRAYDCPRQEHFRDDSKFQDLKIRPFSEESSAPYHWMGKIPEFMNHDARMLEQSPKYFAFKQANWKCRCPVLSPLDTHWRNKTCLPLLLSSDLAAALGCNDVNPMERFSCIVFPAKKIASIKVARTCFRPPRWQW